MLKFFVYFLAINKLLRNSKASVSYIAEHFFTTEVSFHGGFMVTCAFVYSIYGIDLMLRVCTCVYHLCMCACVHGHVCTYVFSLIIINNMYIYIVYTHSLVTQESRKQSLHSTVFDK